MNQVNEERLGAKINGISTPIGDALSVVIPGHQIKGVVRKIPVAGEQQWYSSIFLDGEFVCGVNFGKRGKCFCSRVTRWAMRGVASYVWKHRRKSANKKMKDEAAAGANFDVKAALDEAEAKEGSDE